MNVCNVSTVKLLATGLGALWLCLRGLVGPAAAMTITPANPTISAGQTQQFTASGGSGGLAAVAASAGGEYTCITVTDSSVVDPISGLATAAHVSAGDEFACALLTDGRAKCWALGESGQRGDGSFSTFALTPVDVIGLSGAVAIATGYVQSCALLGDGTIRCWGGNREGTLGDGTTADPGTARPVVVAGITSATAIAAGAHHTCALLSDGTVKCWGRNGQGQLGDGTLNQSTTPVQVQTGAGALSGVTAITAGGAHTCALLADTTVRCWGENSERQLGDGTTFSKPNGIRVTGITGAVAISAGWEHTCAVLANGTARCWGANDVRPAALRPHRQQERAGERQRHRELEPVGHRLRRGLLRVLHQRHGGDFDRDSVRPLQRLEWMRHGLGRDLHGDHELGEVGHRRLRGDAVLGVDRWRLTTS